MPGKHFSRHSLVLAAVAALVLAGCGGDDSEDSKNSGGDPVANPVKVRSTDTACEVEKTALTAGKQTFTATNDGAKAMEFYADVFGWNIQPDGRFTTSVLSPLPATLRQEGPEHDPRVEKVIYLGVPDITATLAKITASGGSIVYPRLEVPGVVVLALFKDPAGNRMGLVELENGKPKVPKAKSSP